MFLIAGPFLLFSDLSSFITINPVVDASMEIALSINKTINDDLRQEVGEEDYENLWGRMLD
jgi:hypothetical protein